MEPEVAVAALAPVQGGAHDLSAWVKVRDRIGAVLEEESGALVAFLGPAGDHFRRQADRADGGALNDDDPHQAENHVTATACVLYLTLGTTRGRSTPNDLDELVRSSADLVKIHAWLAEQLAGSYDLDPDGDLSGLGSTDVADLPNPYNTSIQVCGLLVATRAMGATLPADVARLLPAAARLFVRWASEAVAPRIVLAFEPTSESRPDEIGGAGDATNETMAGQRLTDRPYLLYWTYAGILELTKHFDDADVPAMGAALRAAAASLREHATQALAVLIAGHHSGMEGGSDATDFLFTLLVAALRDDSEHTAGSRELIRHGAHVFLERHVSAEGSMYPRSTALVSRDRSAIIISTAEHCALLMEAAGPYLEQQTEVLSALSNYLLGRRQGLQGWGVSSANSAERRPVYVTAGALAFLQRFHAHLQARIETEALGRLGLTAEHPKADMRSIELEQEVAEILDVDVVQPIKRGARKEAAMSLVLHGPPGTAKTTCAEKLASMLGWPLVQLSPAAFLGRGSDHIDGEAERVFTLLALLEDKVVLFDEFEEMILSRAKGETNSRFLTTSMLPRLHHIRDGARVVFIVATNDLNAIDGAARRFGRIDRIVELKHPSPSARLTMFESVKKRFTVDEEIPEAIGYLEALGFPSAPATSATVPKGRSKSKAATGDYKNAVGHLTTGLTDGFARFGFGHIKEATRRLVARERAGLELSYSDAAAIIVDVANHDPRINDQRVDPR